MGDDTKRDWQAIDKTIKENMGTARQAFYQFLDVERLKACEYLGIPIDPEWAGQKGLKLVRQNLGGKRVGIRMFYEKDGERGSDYVVWEHLQGIGNVRVAVENDLQSKLMEWPTLSDEDLDYIRKKREHFDRWSKPKRTFTEWLNQNESYAGTDN